MQSRRGVILAGTAFAIAASYLGASHVPLETNADELVRLRKGMSRQGNVRRHNLKPLLIIHLGQNCSKIPLISYYQGEMA